MTALLHVITGLNVGGAEAMLAKLLEQGLRGMALAPQVLSLLPAGRIGERIARLGVPIHTAGMRQGELHARDVGSIAATARRVRPALLQGWMHHGNLAASFAARVAPSRPPVVWNIRHSLEDIALEKPMSQRVLQAGRLLSRSPAAIIYNSAVAAHQYERFGFAAERSVVIPNGFDCDRFRPQPGAGAALRARYGIDPGTTIVAMLARVHPMKDHAGLIEAMRRARDIGHDLHLLLAGTGTEDLPPALLQTLRLAMPADRVTLLGERLDVHEWLAGVDIVALSSAWGEAFPNVLGEAMACGVPCVATDVGDSAEIVGPGGRVVPPRDPRAFAAALCWLAGMGGEARSRLGRDGRRRVLEHYALEQIAARYAALYDEVLSGRRGGPRDLAGVAEAA